MDFINKNELPEKCKVTNAIFVCGQFSLKIEQYIMILVVGVDRLVYENDPVSPAASMNETKLLLYSIIYNDQQGAIFMKCDLKYFILATPMPQLEYIKIHIPFFAGCY